MTTPGRAFPDTTGSGRSPGTNSPDNSINGAKPSPVVKQARFLILLLELSGATLLLLDEPTDNLDLASADALEVGLSAFEGTVIAVTHDRWFARSFDRYLLFQGDGDMIEVPEPVWDVQSRNAGLGGGTASPPAD